MVNNVKFDVRNHQKLMKNIASEIEPNTNMNTKVNCQRSEEQENET